jgi:secretion/DNA translocation related CpaE-like protein
MSDAMRPLLITSNPLLLDDIVRLAAAAGVDMSVRDDPTVSSWSTAPLVFVGDDILSGAASRSLPRRDGVIVVRRRNGVDESPPAVWHGAVAIGAEHVAELPDAERWVIDRLAEAGDAATEGGPVISCVPGVGGAGASSLAAMLARESRGLLVDIDSYGAAVPVDGGLRWPDLAATHGRVPPSSLRNALPSVHGVHVLTGTPEARFTVAAPALDSVLDAGSRGFPCTVVDTPRSDSDTSRIAWGRSDLVIIVIGPHSASATRVPALVDGIHEVCTQVAVVARTSPRDSGIWCAAEEVQWQVRVLPPMRHERALAQGDHVYLTPRSTGRRHARAILDAAVPGILT